jgi:hypothetical protein
VNDSADATGFGSTSPRAATAVSEPSAPAFGASAPGTNAWAADVSDATGFGSEQQQQAQNKEVEEDNFGF